MDLRKLAKDAEKPLDPDQEKIVRREQVWSIKYRSPDGTQYAGTVASRIMSGDERFQASRISADVAGRPWATLPPGAQLHAAALGILTIQLRNPPEWLLECAAEDDELAAQLYASCREHDARWFSGDRGSSEGDPRQARISIDPVGLASASEIHDSPIVAGSGSR